MGENDQQEKNWLTVSVFPLLTDAMLFLTYCFMMPIKDSAIPSN